MARPKNPRNAFLSALEEAGQPIYLLDAGDSLVYLNAACERWLGVSAEVVLGTKCLASSLPLECPNQNLIRGLLPLPLGAPVQPSGLLCQVFAVQADNSPALRQAVAINLNGGPAAQDASDLELANSTLIFVLDDQAVSQVSSLTQPQSLAIELRRIVSEVAKLQPMLRSLPGIAGRHPLTARLRKQLEVTTESSANVLLWGNEKCLTDVLARGVCAATVTESHPLPTQLDGRFVDEEQLKETLTTFQRRHPSATALTSNLLLLRADSLSAAVQPLLRDWLVSNNQRVRVISTSSHSLLELASRQLFDLELAVQLSPLEIAVPTLSSRQSDIPAIATHWLEQYQSSRRNPPMTLSRDVVEQLLEFHWTGDLEQLRSVLVHAASRLPAGGVVQPEHLPEVIRYGLQAQRIGRPVEQSINLDDYLEKIERLLLERALQQSSMNKAGAARLLGLTRQRFLRRCEHLQINFPGEPIDFRPADDFDPEALDSSDIEERN